MEEASCFFNDVVHDCMDMEAVRWRHFGILHASGRNSAIFPYLPYLFKVHVPISLSSVAPFVFIADCVGRGLHLPVTCVYRHSHFTRLILVGGIEIGAGFEVQSRRRRDYHSRRQSIISFPCRISLHEKLFWVERTSCQVAGTRHLCHL